MIKLITDEGTFEYADLVELIREYDKNTLDMNVPSNEAMVFKVSGSITYLVNEEFGDFVGDLKGQYQTIIDNIPKRLFMEFGYYRVRE